MSDLADRLADLKERNDVPHGLTDDEAKERFLELLSEGNTISKAGQLAGRSATWFRRRRNPEGANYDPDFTERFEEITAPGGEYKHALVDSLVDDMVTASRNGNVRATEKLLMAWSDEFHFLRPQVAQGPVNVEQLQVFFSELSLPQLLELQNARKRELPVIDQ